MSCGSHQDANVESLLLRQIPWDLQNTVQCCLYEAILLSCFSAAPLWEVTAKERENVRLILHSYVVHLYNFSSLISLRSTFINAVFGEHCKFMHVSPLSCVRLSRTPITALIQSSTALPTLLWLLCGRAELDEETSRL